MNKSTNDRINEVRKKFRTFEDLECWIACRELRMFAAEVCMGFPKEEEYLIKDQILRSARSTTANVAEGYGRFHYQENIQYCRHARGSTYEVLDHFITGVDEYLIPKETLSECRLLVEKSVQLLNGYIRYLESRKKNE
jgi:four helix bundle protein